MVVNNTDRFAGSTLEFEDDWRRVLAEDDQRFYIYPSKTSGRQVDLLEWIKAQHIEDLLPEAGLTNGHILEYGCGSAGISLFLSNLGYQAHICDLSLNALKVAENNRILHNPNNKYSSSITANALQLPYVNNSFDMVMSYGLLEHFKPEPLNQLLHEVIRVLKPGGLFIADIVPGPQHFNARKLGSIVSYLGSLLFNLIKGKWHKLPNLHQSYFSQYFENKHNDSEWREILDKHQLEDIQVFVCRPFPPLSLFGVSERLYTRFISNFLDLHQRFDIADNWFIRRWGWMYLCCGRKSERMHP